MNLDLH